MGRDAVRVRAAQARRERDRAGLHRLVPAEPGALQDPEKGGVRPRADDGHREDPEICAARTRESALRMEEKTKVTILTSTYRIKGHIDLLPGARVTDFMAEARDFIAVTNAEVWELQVGGRQILAAPFINVSRDHIEVILPGH